MPLTAAQKNRAYRNRLIAFERLKARGYVSRTGYQRYYPKQQHPVYGRIRMGPRYSVAPTPKYPYMSKARLDYLVMQRMLSRLGVKTARRRPLKRKRG